MISITNYANKIPENLQAFVNSNSVEDFTTGENLGMQNNSHTKSFGKRNFIQSIKDTIQIQNKLSPTFRGSPKKGKQ